MDKYEECLDEVKMLRGIPPYNGSGNQCKGDGYYAKSIYAKYPKSLIEKANTECNKIQNKIDEFIKTL